MFLPASLASFELAAEPTYSSSTCPNCNPPFWTYLPIKEGIILVAFFTGVVICGQAALAAVSAFIFKKVSFLAGVPALYISSFLIS